MSTAAVAQTDPIIMTINGMPVPRSEFEYSYNKNNGADVIDKKSVDEYVDLFINYKLKVAAALDAHYDTLTSFKQEYTMYRDQQVRPTMVTDADVLVEAKKTYDRAKEQIGPRGLILPAHIMIRVSTQATQTEQNKAKQRIDSIYKALRGGADFAELAKKVSDDIEATKFNTAIAAMMTLINEISAVGAISKEQFETFVKLLCPFAPHLCEELWEFTGHEGFCSLAPWPVFDESKTIEDEIEVAVQENGKLRTRITIKKDATKDEAIAAAKEALAGRLTGTIRKEIYVPGRIVNFVVSR